MQNTSQKSLIKDYENFSMNNKISKEINGSVHKISLVKKTNPSSNPQSKKLKNKWYLKKLDKSELEASEEIREVIFNEIMSELLHTTKVRLVTDDEEKFIISKEVKNSTTFEKFIKENELSDNQKEQFIKAHILCAILGAPDLHNNNILVDEENHLIPIDGGRSFYKFSECSYGEYPYDQSNLIIFNLFNKRSISASITSADIFAKIPEVLEEFNSKLESIKNKIEESCNILYADSTLAKEFITNIELNIEYIQQIKQFYDSSLIQKVFQENTFSEEDYIQLFQEQTSENQNLFFRVFMDKLYEKYTLLNNKSELTESESALLLKILKEINIYEIRSRDFKFISSYINDEQIEIQNKEALESTLIMWKKKYEGVDIKNYFKAYTIPLENFLKYTRDIQKYIMNTLPNCERKHELQTLNQSQKVLEVFLKCTKKSREEIIDNLPDSEKKNVLKQVNEIATAEELTKEDIQNFLNFNIKIKQAVVDNLPDSQKKNILKQVNEIVTAEELTRENVKFFLSLDEKIQKLIVNNLPDGQKKVKYSKLMELADVIEKVLLENNNQQSLCTNDKFQKIEHDKRSKSVDLTKDRYL